MQHAMQVYRNARVKFAAVSSLGRLNDGLLRMVGSDELAFGTAAAATGLGAYNLWDDVTASRGERILESIAGDRDGLDDAERIAALIASGTALGAAARSFRR